MNLTGLSALVTGGTQGVGAAVAFSLAKAGANLILHGLQEDALAIETIRKCRTLDVKVTPLYCNLLQPLDKVLRNLGEHATVIEPELSLR